MYVCMHFGLSAPFECMYVCAAGVFHGPLSAGRAVAVPLGHSGAAGTRSAGAQVYHTYIHTYIHTYNTIQEQNFYLLYLCYAGMY